MKCAYRDFLCLKSSLNMTKTLSGIIVISLHFYVYFFIMRATNDEDVCR